MKSQILLGNIILLTFAVTIALCSLADDIPYSDQVREHIVQGSEKSTKISNCDKMKKRLEYAQADVKTHCDRPMPMNGTMSMNNGTMAANFTSPPVVTPPPTGG